PCPVKTAIEHGVEVAELGADRIYLSGYHGLNSAAVKGEGLAVLLLGGARYDLTPEGLACRK
ncbi:MAG: hypothetical protein RBU25_11505, partial [Lentisphaeria bacterium]|nr:hypothetical protein [Lentisphaeria bacterium]